MNSGWQTACLGDVLAVLKNGLNCKQDKSGHGQRISRIESISQASFDLGRVGYAEISEQDRIKFKLLKGDILFSHINSPIHVGKTAIFDIDEEIYHGVNLLLMRPVSAMSAAYLELYLKYLFERGYWLSVCKQSVNQASVNQQDISRVLIAYPTDLAEQRRIVAILDEAFEAIATAKANAEKNLQNACQLFETHLERVFSPREEGWISTKLGDAFKTLTGNTPSKGNAAYFGKFMPLVKPPELVDDYVDEAADGLSQAGVEIARVLPIGSVMVSCIGNLGKVGINSVQVACNQQINAILPDERRALPEFMFFQALARPFKRQLKAAASGTTVPIVNKSKFNDVEILLPPIRKQHEVVDSLRAFRVESDRLAAIYDQQRAALDELKKSLLHQAFTGALTDSSANKRVAEVA